MVSNLTHHSPALIAQFDRVQEQLEAIASMDDLLSVNTNHSQLVLSFMICQTQDGNSTYDYASITACRHAQQIERPNLRRGVCFSFAICNGDGRRGCTC